jgi:DNA-binding MarR family transcriptional regulator
VSTKLTPSEREVLALLATYGRGSWRDLQAFFSGSRSSLARALSELEKKGLVKRVELPRRKIFYEVTEQGKQIAEEVEQGRAAAIRVLREAFRSLVIRGLVEGAGRLLGEGKVEEAEEAVHRALGGLLLTAFAVAFRLSGEEEEAFERRLREVQRTLQPVLWTTWWVLRDLAEEHPEAFKRIAGKYLEQLLEEHL